jgi:hypothetical protein
MLIGYARSPKAGVPWVLDLQRDALLAAGVTPQKLFEDPASGWDDDHPGLAECLTSLRTLPPILGGLALAGGVVLLIVGTRNKS